MRESSERTVAFQLTDNIVKPHFQSLGIKEHFQTWWLIILVTVIIDDIRDGWCQVYGILKNKKTSAYIRCLNDMF